MRRRTAALAVATLAMLGPMSVAHADPPEPPQEPRAVEVHSLSPLCVQVLGIWICYPP